MCSGWHWGGSPYIPMMQVNLEDLRNSQKMIRVSKHRNETHSIYIGSKKPFSVSVMGFLSQDG